MGVFNGYEFVRLSDFCHVIFYMRHSIGVSVKFEEFLFKIQYLKPHRRTTRTALLHSGSVDRVDYKASIAARWFRC